MLVCHSANEVRKYSEQWRQQNLRVALVPTMGYLHAGHLSLLQLARQQAQRCILSIYVNPSQFAPNEDLQKYPRDLERDLTLCREHGVDLVFCPSDAEMYFPDHSTWVNETSLSQTLCGQSRPQHFRGVATVVLKLFNISACHLAVFGKKDAQQALIIQRLVRDLQVPVEIVLAPIVREADGLAMSSRNKYLSPDERQQALSIHAALEQAETLFAKGERRQESLCLELRQQLEAAGGRIDYVELSCRRQLQPLAYISEPALLAVAVYFGRTRLIDNIFLDP